MIRQMRYFTAVVETGSFSEAAEVCHISQSAISQQVKALEEEMGVLLLDRRGRRFELTEAGRWFYRQARRQIGEMDVIVRETRHIARGERQRLRVGVLSGFSSRILQSAVHDFATAHPNVQMSLACGSHEEIFQKVNAGQLDLVVNDQRRALADHYVNAALGDQTLYALLRQDSPEAELPAIEIEAMRDRLCIVIARPDQRENEAAFWRDVITVRSDILFAMDLEEARLNAAAGTGWFPCDRDMPAGVGTALVPLKRGGGALTRKMFAFWLRERDAALNHEFADALARHFE